MPLLLHFGLRRAPERCAGTPLADLIFADQGVRVLVTSQAPLGIAGELIYRLGGVAGPRGRSQPADAQEYAAMVFFAQRAAAADRRFELSAANALVVAEICRRLDGIPLALELAAARVPALGLTALLARLDDRFRVLKDTGRPLDQRHGIARCLRQGPLLFPSSLSLSLSLSSLLPPLCSDGGVVPGHLRTESSGSC